MLRIERKKIKYYSEIHGTRCRIINKTKGEIFKRMNDKVEIADDVTFGDFFKFLIAEKDVMDTIFAASLFDIPFELFIQDFKQKHKTQATDKFHYLEVHWYAELFESELQLTPDFRGIGVWNNFGENKTIGSIGLDFIPLCELAPYKIRLNEWFEISSEVLEENNDNPVSFKAKKHFTLYDIIQGIFFALTWDGSPEMRDQKKTEIFESVKNRRVKSGNTLREII